MAIDTREKRQAAAVISHYFMGPNVTPNASPDQEWRQEAGWGYPGILAGAQAPVVVATTQGFGGDVLRFDNPGGPKKVVVLRTLKKRRAGGLGQRQVKAFLVNPPEKDI